MCQFFSFITEPVNHPGTYFYFDWEYRKSHIEADDADSHSHICAHFKLNENVCNKYEFNPLTGAFTVDMVNSKRDDREAAEKWARRQDFKAIVEPLIVKPIMNPLELPKVEQVTDEQIGWLKEWNSVMALVGASVRDSVWDSVGASVWASVRASVWASVRDSVWDSVRDSVGASVWDSVWDSVRSSIRAYISAFFNIKYEYDFSSAVKLWEAGLVPSFDGTTWRLHSGEKADVVYEWTPEVQE